MSITDKRPTQADNTGLLTNEDLFLFNEGSHFRLYEKLGAHPTTINGVAGTYFAVWAPNAESVHVIGNFNHWNRNANPLHPKGNSGIWEGFMPRIGSGEVYKYYVSSRHMGFHEEKADPFAAYNEIAPKNASIVWASTYTWQDQEWMDTRGRRNALNAPISIYEMHLGSWMRDEHNNFLNYRDIAVRLADYIKDLGYTHVELLPVMEHPFYGSWGYQTTGYFAPTSRYGTPDDFKFFVDHLHQNGIGVILDWVPSHFPSDGHGLAYFDGTHLFEHSDPRKGFHPDWTSFIFNYGRHEVRSFLISSALSWFDRFHIDGIRVDAVASMLYLDYSRKEGEWVPNEYGGRENIDAIYFLRRLNEEIYKHHPDTMVCAEESTAWPMVSRPTYLGGLGFGFKWDMGWMHDMLVYMSKDPIHRKYHHNQLTFRMLYAFHENYVLSLSHDEVSHGKRSLLDKMPGDYWQKFANLRSLYAYMYAQPGKKLLYMGSEIAQWNEWNFNGSIDWILRFFPSHENVRHLVRDLNRLYSNESALHDLDASCDGFEWISCNDGDNSAIALLRKNKTGNEMIVCAFNFTPVPRYNYVIHVPKKGVWQEVLNSDAPIYGGSGIGNMGSAQTAATRPNETAYYEMAITLPPLAGVFFKWTRA